jgi:Na+-driven multidrug efflux pump
MPVAAGEMGVVCGGLINLQMLSMLPDATLFEAAWAVKARVEDALLVVPSCSIGMILTAFIARYRSGHSRKRARWAALVAIQASSLSFLVLIAGAVGVSLVSPVMVDQLFASSELTLCTVRILFICCLSWPLFGLSTFCCAALEGTGKTLLPAALSLAFVLPVRLLLMWIFKASGVVTGSDIVTLAGAASYAILALSLVCLVRKELRRLFYFEAIT